MVGDGYPADWRKRRRIILDRANGICEIRSKGCTYYATEVDHIIPKEKADPATAHQLDNLRAVCKPCHKNRDRKPAPSVERWTARLQQAAKTRDPSSAAARFTHRQDESTEHPSEQH